MWLTIVLIWLLAAIPFGLLFARVAAFNKLPKEPADAAPVPDALEAKAHWLPGVPAP